MKVKIKSENKFRLPVSPLMSGVEYFSNFNLHVHVISITEGSDKIAITVMLKIGERMSFGKLPPIS